MNSIVNTLPTGSSIALLLPVHHGTNPKTKELQLKSNALLALSIVNIILWTVSTVLGVAILVAFNVRLFHFNKSSLDTGGWGIWCSWFYVIAGFTGYSASYNKRKPLVVATLVFAIFSLLTSIVAASLSGIMGGETSYYYSYYCRTYDSNNNDIYWYRECDVWSGLEFTLMGFSIIAFFINLAVTIITSMALCNCCSKRTTSGPVVMQQVLPSTYDNQQLATMPMYAAPLSPTGVQQSGWSSIHPGQQQLSQPQQVLLATAPQQSVVYPVQQVLQQDLSSTPRSQTTPLTVETEDK